MKKSSLIIYDVVGSALVLALIGVGLWCAIVRPQATNRRTATLKAELAELQATQRANQDVLHRKTAELAELTQDLNRRGVLPEQSPVEKDLHTLAELARASELELLEIAPSTTNTYPGITELQYSVKARSSYVSLIDFMKRFRKASFWADIVDLEIVGDMNPEHRIYTVELVVSLFAANDGGDSTNTK